MIRKRSRSPDDLEKLARLKELEAGNHARIARLVRELDRLLELLETKRPTPKPPDEA